jgi:RHS repeat-associated protein
MLARFRSPLLVVTTVAALFAAQGAGLRAAALGHGVVAGLGPPAPTQALLGEQRWYTVRSFKLSDQLGLEVNVANGNLEVREKTLQIKGTGLDLNVSQFYNSLASGAGSVGNRWRLGLSRDVGLQFPGGGSAIYTAPTGYSVTFASQNGAFADPPGLDASLVKNSDGTYTLTFHQSGEHYEFSSAGVFTADVDRDGNTISFAYGTSGLPKSITDTQGRVVQVTNGSNGFVTKIADSTGRSATYAYSSAGNLLTFTDLSGAQTKFTYDASSDVTGITDPAGHVFTLAYDSSHRVTSITAKEGPVTSFAYSGSTTTVTDPDGNKTTYTSDASGRVTEVADAQGGTGKATYTADDSPAQLTDALGKVTSLTYDGLNNLAAGAAAAGATASALYGSTAHPFLATQATDPSGNVTKFAYGTRGNLTQVTNALGGLTKYAYNANGTVSSLTDAAGNVTTYQYDSAGNLTAVFPNGLDFTYDALSRVATSTDGLSQKTTYAYDALDRVTKVTYADGTSVSQTFDADGNRTQLVDGSGTTTFTYGVFGRLLSEVLPSTEDIIYGYDAAGNLTSRQDAGGTTTYTYNSLGLASSVTDPTGTTTFQYDADHRLVTTAYPNGVKVQDGYDASGDITSVVAGGATTLLQRTYSYTDPAGHQTSQIYSFLDEGGFSTSYGYDALNRLTSSVFSQSPAPPAAPAAGARAVPQPVGNGVIDSRSYAYDALGFRTSQTINGVTTSYTANASNLTLTVGSLVYTFDADGNMIKRSDGLTVGYDAANFTSSETTTTTTALTYSGLDQSDRVGEGATAFVSDLTGLSRIETSSGTTFLTRGPGGNLLSERGRSGTFYYVTDALGSTIGLTASDGSLAAEWKYDPWGNVFIKSGTATTPFLFQGGYADFAGMYYMGQRYYDPTIGMYLQQSGGSGTPADPRTLNPYVYRQDNPNAFTLGAQGPPGGA